MMEKHDLLKNTSVFKISVSSVLNDDVKQNGKQFLYDDRPDTAWMSKDGSSQWIYIAFDEQQNVSGFQLQFQGGFNAACLLLKVLTSDGSYEESFDLEDTNAEQSFLLKSSQKNVKSIRFIFTQNSDFFGRIILYKLNVYT